LHDALRRDGVTLMCRPEIHVGHRKHYTVAGYISQRFHYARSYANARLRYAPSGIRVLYGVTAVGLPPLLFFRIVFRVLAKPGYRWQLICSLPLLALFVCAWAAGELAGAWTGGGDSLSRVT